MPEGLGQMFAGLFGEIDRSNFTLNASQDVLKHFLENRGPAPLPKNTGACRVEKLKSSRTGGIYFLNSLFSSTGQWSVRENNDFKF